jgi:hypothetical protein
MSAGAGPTDETIARLNIEHYRRLLETEKDESKLRTIRELLRVEEDKLALTERAQLRETKERKH